MDNKNAMGRFGGKMRKIKFRGKHHETNNWIYGSLVKMDGGGYAILDGKFSPEHEEVFLNVLEFQAVKYKTIGQFTGLQDKNGNDIYEGDIIKVDENIGRIVWGGYWNYSAFGIETDNPLYPNDKPVTWDALNPEWVKDIEIIGNIHE